MIKQRIKKIVDYLKESEATHFEEGDKPENHIYLDVLAVEKWLNSFSEKKMQCSCGEELKFEQAENYLGNDTDIRSQAYCKCKKVWDLVDCTESYEEMIMIENTEPQFGEYQKDGLWYYEDGSCME